MSFDAPEDMLRELGGLVIHENGYAGPSKGGIAKLPRPTLSDVGNADRLIRRSRGEIKYCWEIGRWFVWDGKRFVQDSGAAMQRRAIETARSIYPEAGETDDPDERRKVASWAGQSEKAPRITAMVEMARSDPSVGVEIAELDANPFVLNVDNGVLDLCTGRLSLHAKHHRCTKVAAAAYNPAAQCPVFMAFLNHIFQHDQDVIGFVKRALGYALTGDVTEQCFFIGVGSGSNGKSTLLATIAHILGDYATDIPAETLLAKSQTNGSAATPDLVRLPGARFVTAVESDSGRRLAEGIVKQMTGGDKMQARHMRGEFFSFQPEFKLWLSTNHKPKIKGTDNGIWRRIRLIPFSVEIPKAQRDESLISKLRAEAPGILAWLVAGCLEWKKNRLGTAERVSEATEAYRAEMDTLGGFLEERCRIGGAAETPSSVLYSAYVSWAQDNGEPTVSSVVFANTLTERGFVRKKTKAANKWIGIELTHPGNGP